jgi:hypothetical protein
VPDFTVSAAYSFLFLFLIWKLKFFELPGINKKLVAAAFLFKILLGITNYLIWQHIIGHGDSLKYFSDSKLIYSTLFANPSHFFQLTFGYSPQGFPEHLLYISEQLNYSWKNVEYTMVRLNTLFNLFSLGSAWGNIIILAFISFVALTALYKTIIRFATSPVNQHVLFAVFFFIPSIVFWLSGILKEGPTFIY